MVWVDNNVQEQFSALQRIDFGVLCVNLLSRGRLISLFCAGIARGDERWEYATSFRRQVVSVSSLDLENQSVFAERTQSRAICPD